MVTVWISTWLLYRWSHPRMRDTSTIPWQNSQICQQQCCGTASCCMLGMWLVPPPSQWAMRAAHHTDLDTSNLATTWYKELSHEWTTCCNLVSLWQIVVTKSPGCHCLYTLQSIIWPKVTIWRCMNPLTSAQRKRIVNCCQWIGFTTNSHGCRMYHT